MSRRSAREEVFKLVFEGEIKKEDTKEILESYLKRSNVAKDQADLDFIKNYLLGISEKNKEILELIDNNMTGWRYERIGFVERAILKYSVYELLAKEIPYEIVVNEAVEIAKKYGDDKTSDFINGVLAKIIKNN